MLGHANVETVFNKKKLFIVRKKLTKFVNICQLDMRYSWLFYFSPIVVTSTYKWTFIIRSLLENECSFAVAEWHPVRDIRQKILLRVNGSKKSEKKFLKFENTKVEIIDVTLFFFIRKFTMSSALERYKSTEYLTFIESNNSCETTAYRRTDNC